MLRYYLNKFYNKKKEDLTNRTEQLESLLSTVNFKKFEKEDLVKIGKKSKDRWLSKNSTWLSIIVSKNSDNESDSDKSSDSDSDKSSDSGSDSEKSSNSEEEEEEEGGSLPEFDKKLSSTTLVFSKKNRRAKYTSSGLFIN
jgi:hypothetical protein